MDPIAAFKENQKFAWAGFAVLEAITGTVSPKLARFANIAAGKEVLDVGCGTGVLALTAARLGAKVTGLDLTPELVDRAKENAALMKLEVIFQQGDAEQLPFADAKFDFVVSQFGHMFAPRPELTISQMLRVLKPGGTIAFTTWPPHLMTGRAFALMGKYAPPPPPGVSPPVQWGDPGVVRERLGSAVKDLSFGSDTMLVQCLSPQHNRLFMEKNFGPAQKLFTALEASEPAKAAELRRELEELTAIYFENNTVRQDYLMTRAVKI